MEIQLQWKLFGNYDARHTPYDSPNGKNNSLERRHTHIMENWMQQVAPELYSLCTMQWRVYVAMGRWGGWKGDDICFSMMHESPLCAVVFAECDLPLQRVEYVFLLFCRARGVCTTTLLFGRIVTWWVFEWKHFRQMCMRETCCRQLVCFVWALSLCGIYQREPFRIITICSTRIAKCFCNEFEALDGVGVCKIIAEIVHAKKVNFRFTVSVHPSVVDLKPESFHLFVFNALRHSFISRTVLGFVLCCGSMPPKQKKVRIKLC